MPGALSEANVIALASGHGDDSSAGPDGKSSGSPKSSIFNLSNNGTLVATLVFIALFSIYGARQPGALALSSITDLCNNILPLALAAAGGTFVVLTRDFDLSVAGVVSLTNVLVATTLGDQWWAPLFGLVMVSAVGICVGAINGLLVAYCGLQSVAATLATMLVCSGIALLLLPTPRRLCPHVHFRRFDGRDRGASYR